MNAISGITNQPNQQVSAILPDGTRLTLSFRYVAQQLGWFFTEVNWNAGQFVERGRRIVNHGNMLRQYKNLLPFGIACFTTGNREPTQVEDFQSGASNLYLLTKQEVLGFEAFLKSRKHA